MKCRGLKRSITRGTRSFLCSLILAVKRTRQEKNLLPPQDSMLFRVSAGCRSTPRSSRLHHSAGGRSASLSEWAKRKGSIGPAHRRRRRPIGIPSVSAYGPIRKLSCPSCFTAESHSSHPAASRVSRLIFYIYIYKYIYRYIYKPGRTRLESKSSWL